MKKLIVGVAAALCFLTNNAVADGPYKRPPPTIAAPVPGPPPLSWTGFYIGAGIGAGVVLHDHHLFDDLGPFARHHGLGADGIFGTLIIGYDWQIGAKTVFGVFVDYDFSDASHTFTLPDFLIRTSIDHDQTWAIGARLGWLSSPSTLWYLTGGYTQADFTASVTIDDVRFSRDRSFDGYFVGGGVDTRLAASNWFLRLEYRFSEFDRERFFLDDETGLAHHFESQVHTTRLTLTYKFGGGYGWGSWGQ